ncbi:MAG: Fur family transcriptional regulator [Acutalibacteraceae bacterium]
MPKYNTRQRDEIIRCLNENKGRHMTADEVHLLLTERGKNVGRTTVYRHLEALCQSGELLKFTAGGGGCCYQAAGAQCASHLHTVCERCGRLFHVQCSEMEALGEHFRLHHGFVVDMTRTAIYGVCRECLKSEEKQ